MSVLKLTKQPNFDRTEKLLDTYRLLHRGGAAVREMILQDIGRFSEMGADAYVADLRKALFRFDDETCESAYSPGAYHHSDPNALEVGM